MADVTCPKCDHEFDVGLHDNWDENGFDIECPECYVPLCVEVETEYSYEAELIQ